MKVSVIIPCYNAEPYLAQAIGSALDQRHPPHEVIVVDDGSTDGSLAVAQRFAACEGSRIRVLSERSGRASRTRNLGAALATGEALMFLDADDVLGPDTLEALADALKRRPGGIAVCPWYRLDFVDERWVERPPSCKPRRPGQDALSAWLTGWYHPPCSVLWSREAFERVGRWDEQATVNDDGDIVMRALVQDIPLVPASSGAGYYRRLPDGEVSLSETRFTRDGLASSIRVTYKIACLLEEQGQVDQYRAALSRSFHLIANDAKGRHPDLYEQAETYARRYAPPSWVQAKEHVLQVLKRQGQRLHYGLRRRVRVAFQLVRPEPTEERVTPGLEEIRYGLYRAAQVLHTEVDPATKATPAIVRLDRPVVSVVIPTYNRASMLVRALDSVMAQTFDDFEVLVVDDGSTDETKAVVKSYGDACVRYLCQPKNRGVSAARNRGLREARGAFIAFLDSDDVWFPHKLEAQVQRFRELPEEVGLLYGGVEDDYGEGRRRIRTPTYRGDLRHTLLQENVIHGTSGVMIRRNVVAAVGFFDEEIPAIEDYDYWLRITRFFEVDFIEAPLIRYHDPRGGAERKSLDRQDNREARDWMYRKHIRAMRRAGMAHRFLLKSAKRHLAHDDVWRARRFVVRALLEAPASPEVHAMLRRTFFPTGLRQRLRKRWHAVHRTDQGY